MLHAAAVFALLATGACATAPTAEEDDAMLRDSAREVTCTGAEDCEIKWGQAVQWVIDNGAFRIQIQTDTMIQTAGPLPNDPRLAMVITKVARGNGVYAFQLQGGCDNMFGCSPTIGYAKAYFVRAVMDGQPGRFGS